MRILYFNYQISSFASIVRSLEYAKGAADEGHDVALCYLHPLFRPPEWYYDLLASYESTRLRIHYPPRRHKAALTPVAAANAGEKSGRMDGLPDMGALCRQIAVSPKFIPEELRLVDSFRPDVLMARSDPTLSFMATAKLRSLPLVLETDGPVEEMDHFWGVDSRWVRPLDTWRARRADAILYISEACRDIWLGKRVAGEKLFYTPNGAHPDTWLPQAAPERRALRSEFGLDGKKVIGFSGILRPWHGVDNLLAAAIPILREDPDLRILFIGLVEDASVLDRCGVPEAMRQGRLVFTGRVPYARMGAHIDMADCLALPYPRSELFHFSPMKLFEGMSLGKVIVAPRMGQITELLGDLSSPVLYDPGDGVAALRQALVEGLRRGLSGAEGRPAGADARARIKEAHTWAHRGKVVARACEYALARRLDRKVAA